MEHKLSKITRKEFFTLEPYHILTLSPKFILMVIIVSGLQHTHSCLPSLFYSIVKLINTDQMLIKALSANRNFSWKCFEKPFHWATLR